MPLAHYPSPSLLDSAAADTAVGEVYVWSQQQMSESELSYCSITHLS